MKYVWTYIYNWLVLLSKGLNVLFGGSPHESLSEKIGRKNYKEDNPTLFWVFMKDIVNDLFFWEKDHVLDALDDESHAKDLWDEL